MSRDNFDDEIAELYQQRKQQVVPPAINVTKPFFEKAAVTKKHSPVKLLSILFAGSMVSFGIMAIISHFSTLPKKTNTVSNSDHQVELVEVAPKLPDEEVLPVRSLPPVPVNISPIPTQIPEPEIEKNNEQIKPKIVNPSYVSVITLPSLSRPKAVIEPTYKVLPKYSLSDNSSHKDGEIKLSYQIDNSGRTTDIDIVSSNVDRNLQRSAKKALSQWQYKPNELMQNVEHQVVFKFTAP